MHCKCPASLVYRDDKVFVHGDHDCPGYCPRLYARVAGDVIEVGDYTHFIVIVVEECPADEPGNVRTVIFLAVFIILDIYPFSCRLFSIRQAVYACRRTSALLLPRFSMELI